MRPDAPERQSIECRAFLYFLDFEPNTCPALPSDTVAKEVASHAERGLWDLLRVRELSEVGAKRRVLRSTRRTHVRELGYEVR